MSKKHNRQNKSKKGPQLSEGERLWKRMSSAIGQNQELWAKAWNAASIAELLIKAENHAQRFAREQKAERVFRAKLDQSLAEIRKQNEFFTTDEQRNITLRSLEEIGLIKQSIADWQSFFEQHSNTKDLFQGPPTLDAEPDKSRYQIIENAWLSILDGSPFQQNYPSWGLTKWGKFDLIREIGKFADARCGFRFQDSTPSIALLLLQNQQVSIAELLDLRLAARKRDGRNPFPRNYDEKLAEHSNQQSEVNGDNEVKSGRTDLRHLPFVTIDPHDAKDFDDAVCLIEEDGVETLWVAIADVANYVRKDTRLDAAARLVQPPSICHIRYCLCCHHA